MKRLPCILALAAATACADDGATADGTDGDSEGSEGSAADDGDDGEGDDADGTADGAACDEPPAIECPPDASVACEGPQTSVPLDAPVPACDAWTVSSDAPDAYPVGQTEVTFELDAGGDVESCSTTVIVVDDVAPDIECPPTTILVRTAADAPVAVPAATATDLCSDVEVEASAGDLPTGTTIVEYTATDAAGNVATCSTEFGVVEVFAAPEIRIVHGALLESGETEITLAWEPFQSPLVSGYRVETATAPDGPWDPAATLAATDRIHTMHVPDDVVHVRLVTESSAGDGGGTEPLAAYRIAPELYDLRDVAIPGIPFPTTLYGVLRHPVALDAGPFPLVVMLHGNHGNCRDTPDSEFDYCSTSIDHECSIPGAVTTPNAEGLTYLVETMAAQGVHAVSISGNAMNCRDGYIFERARLIREHLRVWRDWNDGTGDLADLLAGTVDLSRVGLVGHSRGGDATSNTPGILEASPLDGVTVRSVFSIAPTDFHQVVVRDTHLGVLLPSCDHDVVPLSGRDHYDRSSAFPEDGVHHAQVFFIGANHNFFNTEWRISDVEFGGTDPFCMPDDDELQQLQQRSLAAMLGGWFRTTFEDDAPEAYMRAEVPSPPSLDLWTGSALDLRWSYADDERVVIDDFDGPGSPVVNALGGDNAFTDWFLAERCFGNGCDPYFFHLEWVMRLLWEVDQVPLARLGLAGYDGSGDAMLSFRVVSRLSTLNAGLSTQDFVIRLRDAEGTEVEVLLSDLKTIQHLYPQQNPVEILETVRIPLAELVAQQPALDLAALGDLELEMTALDHAGSVIVTDFELAR